MKTLITAAFNSALAQGEIPTEIVYFPEGEHQLTATVDGKPGAVAVKIPAERGHEIAAKFQAGLTALQSGNVRPFLGFDHKPGAASALPKAFRYEPGVGVMLAVDWTRAGSAGIEGRDWSFFSPTFHIGDDGLPAGLPDKGEIGSLTNSPAFRNIQRIAASDAGTGDDRFYRDLAAATAGELASEEEAKAFIAEYGVDGNLTPEQRMEGREKAEADEAEEAAKELEKRATQRVASGQAASFEEGMIQAAQADGALYLAACTAPAMKKSNPAPKKDSVVGASDFESKARALVTAGQASSIDEAFGLVAAADPTAYTAYLATLH